jgi:hypothetical protein
MIRHRKLAVCALDLDVSSRTGNTQYFVTVAFAVVGQCLSLLRALQWLVVCG